MFKRVIEETKTAYKSTVTDSLDELTNIHLQIKSKISSKDKESASKPNKAILEKEHREIKDKALGKLGLHNLDEIVDYFEDSEWNEFLTLY